MFISNETILCLQQHSTRGLGGVGGTGGYEVTPRYSVRSTPYRLRRSHWSVRKYDDTTQVCV